MTSPISPTLSYSHTAPSEIKLKIDKLTLLMDLPLSHQKGLVEWFIGLGTNEKEKALSGYTRAYGKGCGGYRESLACHVPISTTPLIWSKATGFIVQVGATLPTATQVRIDINPTGLNPTGMAHLRDLADWVFNLGWENLKQACVSRMDAAVDLHGIRLNDWQWDLPKRHKREVFADKGAVRTLYIGSKRKDPLVIYDKAYDLKLPDDEQRTRVEFRARNAGLLEKLGQMANPLSDIIVFYPQNAGCGWIEPLRKAAMAAGYLGGRRSILELVQANVRKVIQVKLQGTEPTWWSPEAIWKLWPAAVSSTLLDLVGSPVSPATAA